MSKSPQPISRRVFKLGLKNAHLFKKIVDGDLAMFNHVSGNAPRDYVYFFAGIDVANILAKRNMIHGSNLEQNLLDSQLHFRLRQFILAGELTRHYYMGEIATKITLEKMPEWIKKDAKKILFDYAIGTYGAVKHGHAKVEELYHDEFKQHLQAVTRQIAELWDPKKLGPKYTDDESMGRNALYDVMLARPEIFIAPYGAI